MQQVDTSEPGKRTSPDGATLWPTLGPMRYVHEPAERPDDDELPPELRGQRGSLVAVDEAQAFQQPDDLSVRVAPQEVRAAERARGAAVERAMRHQYALMCAERVAIVAGALRRSPATRCADARWQLEQDRFYEWALRRFNVTDGEQERVLRVQLPAWAQTFTALEPAGLSRKPPQTWRPLGPHSVNVDLRTGEVTERDEAPLATTVREPWAPLEGAAAEAAHLTPSTSKGLENGARGESE